MKCINAISNLMLICFFTLVTQVGGIILLLIMLFQLITGPVSQYRILRQLAGLTSFIILYAAATFWIIPPLAETYGRFPLPCNSTNNLQPVTIWTCILNRNYVNAEMLAVAQHVSKEMETRYPGTVVNYLDAGFPFIEGFPLFPHLSHNDGKKLDLSFSYNDYRNTPTNRVPSLIGYGAFEEPGPGEQSMLKQCADKGYWQYNIMDKTFLSDKRRYYFLNEERTQFLINLFADNSNTEKIFIEPYLKKRLHLENSKVRFQGCQSVRHDDHFHVQVK